MEKCIYLQEIFPDSRKAVSVSTERLRDEINAPDVPQTLRFTFPPLRIAWKYGERSLQKLRRYGYH